MAIELIVESIVRKEKMEEFDKEKQIRGKNTEIKTFPVPFKFREIQENITITSNSYKEQMINKAFNLHKKHKYVYDLSEAWFKLTGLPFVFACWIAKKEISHNILNEINSAFSHGLNNINTALKTTRIKNIDYRTVKFYLKNRISYNFDKQKKKSMDIFLEQINDL